jgi:hypothetical protein
VNNPNQHWLAPLLPESRLLPAEGILLIIPFPVISLWTHRPIVGLVAEVVKLVDALRSGRSIRKDVGVRIPPSAVFVIRLALELAYSTSSSLPESGGNSLPVLQQPG